MIKKEEYVRPELLVLELDPENQLLETVSGGKGRGSNMMNPDYGQNPFSY